MVMHIIQTSDIYFQFDIQRAFLYQIRPSYLLQLSSYALRLCVFHLFCCIEEILAIDFYYLKQSISSCASTSHVYCYFFSKLSREARCSCKSIVHEPLFCHSIDINDVLDTVKYRLLLPLRSQVKFILELVSLVNLR